jgi:ABC-type spermidine/putrescine transport system permease subunit I
VALDLSSSSHRRSVALPSTVDRASSAERAADRRLFLLCVPLLVTFTALFLYPVVRVLLRSFGEDGFSFSAYQQLASVLLYQTVMVTTLRTAATVTVACLLLGYPLAYVMSQAGRVLRIVLLVLVLVPFWVSLLIRSYAWMVLLQRNGLINDSLRQLGLIGGPLDLIRNPLSVTVGMTHALLPYVVLPLFAVMLGIDRRLLQAAASLGAGPLAQFWRVFLPLSLPGVLAGGLLVFILALGFFITPALLGGPKDTMIAMLISQQTSSLLNWPLAAALSAVLLTVTLVLYVVADRFAGLDHALWGGRSV